MGFESLSHLPTPVLPQRKQEVAQYVKSEAERVDRATQKRVGPEAEQKAYCVQEQLTHGQLDINFVGLRHEPETLLKYRKQIESVIRESDFVVVEAVLNVGQKEHMSTAALAEQRSGNTAPDVLFGEIENMARKHGKPIVSMDALTSSRNLAEGIEMQQYESMEALKTPHRVAGMLGVAAALGAAATEQPQGKKPLNRREFLRGAAYATGAVTGLNSLLNGTDLGYYKTGVRTLLHGGQDYRDVVLAEGMDVLAKKFSKPKKVAVMYGAAHFIGLKHYLENPNLRATKRKLYAPLDKAAQPEMRGYAFHEGDGQTQSEWRETFRVKV